jgi:DNA polymerase-1
MNRVNRKLKDKDMKSRLILQVHDELLVEAHKDEIEEVKQIIVDEMVGAAVLDVALETEVKMGHNWYETK